MERCPHRCQGWVVINSLRGGAAGGGTRMRKGLTKDEVVSLAKVMEIKFSVCGPPIGAQNRESTSIPRIHAARRCSSVGTLQCFHCSSRTMVPVVTSMSTKSKMWCPSPKSWAYGILRKASSTVTYLLVRVRQSTFWASSDTVAANR